MPIEKITVAKTDAQIKAGLETAIDRADEIARLEGLDTALTTAGKSTAEFVDKVVDLSKLSSSASEIDRVSREIPKTALNALSQAQNRRVDLVMIGDSNQLKDGFGFAGAFMQKLGEKYGLYATGIGSSITTGNERHFNAIVGTASSGAPKEIESIYPSNSPEPYSYLAEGQTLTPSQSGVSINPNSLLDTKKQLTFWTCWGSFTSGTGKFRRQVRYGASPYTTLTQDSTQINTNTGEAKKQFTPLTIPADVNRLPYALECKVANVSPWTLSGSFVEFYSRIERPDLEKGVSVHTLYGVGGQSLYDMASTLIGYSDLALKNFFEETRRLQLAKYQKPIIIVYINSGLNDLNETEASLGDLNVPVGNSKEAYFDNLNKIIDRIEKVYSDNWDINELHFLIMPSHPTGNETEIRLDEYRLKCKETYFNRARCSYINPRDLVTSDYMLSKGYYLVSGTDRYHLNKDGYLDLVGKVVNTLR